MKNWTSEIDNYLARLKTTIDSLDRAQISHFINVLLDARDNNKTIFIMGNGGSAATASHFCCDFNKGASYGYKKRFKFICLNDNVPTVMAYGNDTSYDDIFVEQLKNLMSSGDLVIGISGSGNSKNVINAIEWANANGAQTFALLGYNGGKLKNTAQKCVHVNIDDMQITEDLHMVLDHLIMKVICDSMAT